VLRFIGRSLTCASLCLVAVSSLGCGTDREDAPQGSAGAGGSAGGSPTGSAGAGAGGMLVLRLRSNNRQAASTLPV
jgi:hypothetical protein